MSKRKKRELAFGLFGPLISKWFVGLNDKKICLELTTWLLVYMNYLRIVIVDPSDPTRRELFWMQKVKTLAPLGLNAVEGV